MRISDWSSDVCSSDLFDTLRFATQPIAGLRIYYCEHLTPVYVWDKAVMHHDNGATSLDSILIKAPDARSVSTTLAALVCGQARDVGDGSYRLSRTEERRVGEACVRRGRCRWGQE